MGPTRYKDHQWDSKFIRLDYHGVGIDFGGAYDTKLYDAEKKKWIHSVVDFSKNRKFEVNGLKIEGLPENRLRNLKKKKWLRK